jgi:hypothetical protein
MRKINNSQKPQDTKHRKQMSEILTPYLEIKIQLLSSFICYNFEEEVQELSVNTRGGRRGIATRFQTGGSKCDNNGEASKK